GASAVGVGGPLAGRLMLAVRLGDRLEIALLTAPLTGPLPPHPAARDPMIIVIAATARLLLSRIIPVLPSSRSPMDPPDSLLPTRPGVFTRHGWAGSARLARLDEESLGRRNEWPARADAPVRAGQPVGVAVHGEARHGPRHSPSSREYP